MQTSKVIVFLFLFAFNYSESSTNFSYDPSQKIYGEIIEVKAVYEDTLVDLARTYNLGFNEIIQANPTVDKWLPGEGTLVKIPSAYILPNNYLNDGITINLSEFRGYLIQNSKLITFPVGIGRMDWKTPLGLSEIDLKLENPAWYPPKTVRDEYKLEGLILDAIVPPGPNNPLGKLAMRINIPGGYFIHGTNRPDGVGMEISHGCIRLFPEDIKEVFKMSSIGTRVLVIDEPIKLAKSGNKIFLQFHHSKYDSIVNEHYSYLETKVINYVTSNNIDIDSINWIKVKKVFEEKSGLIDQISYEDQT